MAEWGLVGLLGLLSVFVGVSLRLAKGDTVNTGALRTDPPPDETGHEGGSIMLWTGGIGAIVFAGWAGILAESPQDYIALMLYLPAISWVLASIAAACESSESRVILDDPPGPMLAALCAGMIGFLIHTGIDLALFQGGAATTFFALLAVALAVRGPSWQIAPGINRAQARFGLCATAIGAAGLVAFVIAIVRPMAAAGTALQEARSSVKGDSWEGYQNSPGFQSYVRAIDAWPLDGTALDEMVEELSRRAGSIEQVDFLTEYARMLQARDPQNASAHHYLAMLYYRRFSRTNDPADRDHSISEMKRAVAAYPTSPSKRLMLAMLYEQFAQHADAPDLRKPAAAELQMALDLDDRRIYVSAPNRLSVESRAAIQKRLSLLAVPASQP
jgi:hypothetical protein